MPEPCGLCPLRGSGTPCPDPAYYCDKMLRDSRLPAHARYWANAARIAAGIGPATGPEPSPPGLLAMAGSLARAVVGHVADGGRKAPPEVQAARKALCEGCPMYDLSRHACTKCGCVAMDLKRSWASSACPLPEPRWVAV